MRVLFFLSLVFVLSCGQSIFYLNILSKGELSEEQVMLSETAFEKSLYPVLRSRCIQCHADEMQDVIQPSFANEKVDVAHKAIRDADKVNLQDPAKSRIVEKIKGGHNCWSDCEQNSAELLEKIEEWASLIMANESTSTSEKSVIIVSTTKAPVTTTTVMTTTTTTLPPPQVTLEGARARGANILAMNCSSTSCHGASGGKGGFSIANTIDDNQTNMVNFQNAQVSAGRINKNTESSSKIYRKGQGLDSHSGGGRLTAQEATDILKWFQLIP